MTILTLVPKALILHVQWHCCGCLFLGLIKTRFVPRSENKIRPHNQFFIRVKPV